MRRQMTRFRDRHEAGRQLATMLGRYAGRPDTVVLGLPRGGVPVAYEVARALRAPLDVLVVRKLGVPGREELAMGAIATGGIMVLDERFVCELGISAAQIAAVTEAEGRELERRERLYRGDRPPPEVRGRAVLLVDDGIATGATIRAAIRALRQREPRRIVVAAPTAARDTCAALRREADEVVCVIAPEPFLGVGIWYEDFAQTSDDQVRQLFDRAMHECAGRVPA